MKECRDIRNEIDQASLADQPTASVQAHLRGCADCSRFAAEQRALQGMMASLGTVSAPADFDFRLRARLAREKSAAGNGGFATFLSLLKSPRPLAVAALVLLLAFGGVLVRNWFSRKDDRNLTAGKAVAPVSAETPGEKNPPLPTETEPAISSKGTTASKEGNRGGRIESQPGRGPHSLALASRKIERRATRDEALSPAAVLMGGQGEMGDGIVRVPLDDEGLKITIDDGRGSPRTISLPRFSFGQQRLTGHSFVPVSSKGVW